jgi:plasmid stabilization system protein ParE
VLTYHPEAAVDVRDAVRWYEDQQEGLGTTFLEAVLAAEEASETRSLTFAPYIHGTRRYRIPRFPFDFVIRVTQSNIEVVAVAHTSRRSGYWQKRT